MRALDKLKAAVSMKAVRKSIELPNGTDFEFWMTPLTLAERGKAQKAARSDDTTDFALQLLVSKSRDENNSPLFHQGDLAELRNSLPATVVEGLMLLLLGDQEADEEDEDFDMKSSEGTAKEGQPSDGGTRSRRKAS